MYERLHEQSSERQRHGPDELFFDAHREELRTVFEVLGISEQWSDDLRTFVERTQPWVKGDHGHQSYEFNLSESQKQELHLLYPKFDMVEQRDLPSGHYDDILVLGAVHLGNDKRVGFQKEMVETNGVTASVFHLMGGERSMFPEREPEDVQRNVRSLQAKGLRNGWLARFANKSPQTINETDMLGLAFNDHFYEQLGPRALKRVALHVGLEQKQVRSVPLDYYEFELDGAPVFLTHTEATDRKDGDRRHTTEKCIEEWYLANDPPDDARVAFIGSQPHLDRMVRSAERKLRSLGSNLRFVAGGPGVTEETGHTIFLGEPARNAYEDWMRQRELAA